MTEISPDSLSHLVPLDLTDVSPSTLSSAFLLHGVVTVKWPYSSTAETLTFVLADPDPRKRASGGQVKITLLGPSAEFLDQIECGDELSIAPPTDTIPSIEEEYDSPRLKWHLEFHQGCLLIVLSFFHHG